MKLLRKATYAIVVAVVMSSTFQCSSSKVTTTLFEEQPTFKHDPVYFQEWYAGIKVGGTGINLFFPNLNNDNSVELDSVYFRNLKGKLVKGNGRYMATIKNDSPYYTFKVQEKSDDYPFTLALNECVISYTENGKKKYFKITNLDERAGTYYENGPPSIYEQGRTKGLATVDETE